MDGRVEHSGAQSPDVDVTEVTAPEAIEFKEPPREVVLNIDPDSPEPELVRLAPDGEEFEGSFHFADESQFESEPEPEAIPEYDPDLAPEEATGVVYSASAPQIDAASPDLSDIARFGNSDSAANEGSLRYRVFVVGIDTADVRESFREAITDRKMMWDTEEILRSIKNGEVELQNISPAKAYIIISRLRTLPVQIRWEQYAIAQT